MAEGRGREQGRPAARRQGAEGGDAGQASRGGTAEHQHGSAMQG